MHAYSDRNRTAWLASALFIAWLSGCSSTSLQAPGTCVQGQTELCVCASGATGFRACKADSEYGQCFCEAPGTAGLGGAGGEPIAGSAGSSIGGSTGAGGAAAAGGASAMAGIGGGGGSAGAAGGSIGSGGRGGSSGMPEAGAPGGGTGGMNGPGRDPNPGELYGACLSNNACDADLLCVNDASGGMQETYCSTTCNLLSAMPCPRSRAGMASCVFGVCVR